MAEQEPAGEIERAMRTILQYLIEHPDAKDTVEGIMRWWGDPLHHVGSPESIRQGLEELARRGWISVRTGGTGIRLYGLDKAYLAEVQRHLHG